MSWLGFAEMKCKLNWVESRLFNIEIYANI